MIEGYFKDASLPGLLQFLATESNKLYRVKLSASGNSGEIFVQNGSVISAKFNLLDGEDAMCEFLSWRDGAYTVERLPAEFETTVSKNINLRLQGPSTFVSQSNFLVETNVGLNTVIVASTKFGGLDWQDALRTQPLDREDFLVIAFLKDGRTLREACREFNFDIVKATGILYRLLLTHSVEALRPGDEGELGAEGQANGPYQLRLSSGETPEMKLAPTQANEQKRAPKAVPVDLAELRASMEARMRSKDQKDEKGKAGEATNPGKSRKGASRAGQSSGPLVAPGMSAGSGAYETGIASSVSSTLNALGAAVESKSFANADQSKEPEGADKVAAAVSTEEGLVADESAATIDCAPDAVSANLSEPLKEEEFTGRRTDALPLVTIDIERLLQAFFTATQFGQLALTNQALDPHLRQTLIDVDAGKCLLFVLEEAARPPASILSTYRFCLARGYIISADPVIPLTADLLLGRMELDQYLLQRRRINGDELRDLIEIERQKGVKLCDLLVRHGYLTVGDLERLLTEQKRFTLK